MPEKPLIQKSGCFQIPPFYAPTLCHPLTLCNFDALCRLANTAASCFKGFERVIFKCHNETLVQCRNS